MMQSDPRPELDVELFALRWPNVAFAVEGTVLRASYRTGGSYAVGTVCKGVWGWLWRADADPWTPGTPKNRAGSALEAVDRLARRLAELAAQPEPAHAG